MRRRKIKGVRVTTKLKLFNCKSCGSPVDIKILGQTLNVVCGHCKSIIDANDPDFKVLQEYTSKKKYESYIPIGAVGKLKGKTWSCSGFLVKSDSGYFWNEYLLFNPYYGYRWLVEVDGHWALYKKIHRAESVSDHSKARYKGKNYRIFNNGIAVVEYVEGEFYWRVKRGNSSSVHDYISPPSGLSVEITEHEENWTLGHHIDAKTIQKAFGITRPVPFQSGVGQLQPSPVKEKLQESAKVLLYAVVALFMIHLFRIVTSDKKVLISRQIRVSEAAKKEPGKYYTTPSFQIEGGRGNVKLDVYASIQNSWVYVDALLVDAVTQKGIPIPVEVSYYSGRDWSEGSRSNSRLVSNVPAGEYYLSIRNQADSRSLTRMMTFKLQRDVPIHSNLYIVLFLVIIGPLFTFFKSYGFEKRRWSNSDYSPYPQES
jgi:hypothetical protein